MPGSDGLNQDEIDNDAANQEMLIDIFYKRIYFL